MIEFLSATDIDTINEMRARAAGTHNCAGWMNIRQWLSPWDSAKNDYLGKMFDGNLILSKKIHYSLSVEEIATKINKKLFNDYFHADARANIEFKKQFKEAFRYLYKSANPDCQDMYWAICALMDTDNLARNTFEYSSKYTHFDIPIPHQDKPFRLQIGAKVSRAIGRLCQLMNINGWEPLRLKISQILNDSNITGELCLSIHPLDYMTASVNNNNWSSCMNWDKGEYRRGVIEMMNSEKVVCAYIPSKHDNLDIGGYNWNSKKWREFFIVSEETITSIKGYPYCNKDVERIVVDWLKELAEKHNIFPEVKWNREPIIYDVNSDIAIDGIDKTVRAPEFECGPAMYNDFYSGNQYIGYFSDQLVGDYQNIFYSGYSECVICGGNDWDGYYDDDYAGGLLICYSCNPTIRCECCGDRYDQRDMYEVDGLFYCRYCYENMPICDVCGDRYDPEQGGITDTELVLKDIPNPDYTPILLRESLHLCCTCEQENVKSRKNLYDRYYKDNDRYWGCCHYFITVDDLSASAKIALFGTDDPEAIKQECLDNGWTEDEINNGYKSCDDNNLDDGSLPAQPLKSPIDFLKKIIYNIYRK